MRYWHHGAGVKRAVPLPSGVWWWIEEGHWLGLVLCISFSALTLMVWLQETYLAH